MKSISSAVAFALLSAVACSRSNAVVPAHAATDASTPAAALATTNVPAPATPAPKNDVETIAAAQNAFATRLASVLGKGKNVVFSPSSISAALAMTYAGARGDTAKEVQKTLGFDALSDEKLHAAYQSLLARWTAADSAGLKLEVANRLFGEKGYSFEPSFLALTKDRYGAPIETVDFGNDVEGARKTIDAWVDAQTAHAIPELIKEGVLDDSTRLVLVNAIHFKGDFAEPFDKGMTSDQPFATPTGSVKVPTMHRAQRLRYAETANAQYVAMPFVGDRSVHDLELDVVLPKDATGTFSLGDAIGSLGNLDGAVVNEVDLALPRFKLSSAFDLSASLAKLGMPAAFDDMRADFTGMTAKEHLHIKAVVHQALLDVNEAGVEAAAATGVVMDPEAMFVAPKAVMNVDRRFEVAIRDRATGAVLFAAEIVDPR